MANRTLLPCPFCGSAAEIIAYNCGANRRYWVKCIKCIKCGARGPDKRHLRAGLAAWNRRTVRAAKAQEQE